MPAGSVWDRFEADPRDPAHTTLRASDADRDVVLGVLRDAYAAGKVDTAEYERRVDAALEVVRLGQVLPLLEDLASTRSPARRARRAPEGASVREEALATFERDLRDMRTGWIALSVLLVGIWGATSVTAGDLLFFWPVFPVLAVGVGYLSHRLNPEKHVEELEEKIARRRRRRRED